MNSRRRSPYRPGRPSYYADMDFKSEPDLVLLDKFYAVARSLTFREMLALAHTFGLSRLSVWRWKVGRTAPRYSFMAKVIAWGEAGKPLVKKQRERDADVMW